MMAITYHSISASTTSTTTWFITACATTTVIPYSYSITRSAIANISNHRFTSITTIACNR
jgi:hypothetical protein